MVAKNGGNFAGEGESPLPFLTRHNARSRRGSAAHKNHTLLQYMPAFPGKHLCDNGDVCGTHLDTSTKLPPSLACVALKWVFTKLA
jgi:hypothetical protein